MRRFRRFFRKIAENRENRRKSPILRETPVLGQKVPKSGKSGFSSTGGPYRPLFEGTRTKMNEGLFQRVDFGGQNFTFFGPPQKIANFRKFSQKSGFFGFSRFFRNFGKFSKIFENFGKICKFLCPTMPHPYPGIFGHRHSMVGHWTVIGRQVRAITRL